MESTTDPNAHLNNVSVTHPIELYVVKDENGDVDISVSVMVEGLDNQTLRQEVIISHAQIELLLRIVSGFALCLYSRLSGDALKQKSDALQVLIDLYEADYGILGIDLYE
jgi:hypothetical protein